MLTDDDLTRDLRAAFRGATDDLTYTGTVPRLRRSPLVAGPAVATPGRRAVTRARPTNRRPAVAHRSVGG